MRKLFISLLGLIFLIALVSPLNAQQNDNRLQIIASYSILADVVSVVAGDTADVSSLMPLGADPHSFQPAPQAVVALAEADVVFINGANFEEGLLSVIENAGEDMRIVVASSCVPILPFGANAHDDAEADHGHDDDHDDQEHDEDMSEIAQLCAAHIAEMVALHEAGHEHGHDDDHADDHDDDMDDHAHDDDAHNDAEADHGHEHRKVEPLGRLYELDCGGHDDDDNEGEHLHAAGECDPHVWTEPHNVMYWVMLIRDTLIQLDPANAETYTANAAAYLSILDDLAHHGIRDLVAQIPEDGRILVTNHETLGYYANGFGFELVGTVIPTGGTASAPSARDLADLIELIRAEGVTAIFAETTVSDAVAQQVADEAGARVYLLYSDSLSEADGPAATYLDYMLYNTQTIVEALTQ